VAGQVDEYVDVEDEMPTSTYQSVEIKKCTEVVTVSGCSGNGLAQWLGSQWRIPTIGVRYLSGTNFGIVTPSLASTISKSV
jgi:hypothetical protein